MRKLFFITTALINFGNIWAKSTEIKNLDVLTTSVNIWYPTPLCNSSFSVTPVITGTGNYLGGTFSASPSSLLINSTTGEVNSAFSPPGSYIVSYTLPAGPDNPMIQASFSILVTSANINYLMPDFTVCDSEGINDGKTLYIQNPSSALGSLAGYVSAILGSQPASSYSVEFYYNSQADAEAGNSANALTNLATYQVQTGTYYVRVENTQTGCYAIDYFTVIVQALVEPIITTNTGSNIACVNWNTTTVTNDLVLSSGITNPNYTFKWYKDGVYIDGQNSSTLAITSMDLTESHSIYNVKAISNLLECTSNISALSTFAVIRSGPASSEVFITNLSGVQTITVASMGYGFYQYSIDSGPFQSSPVFENVPIGTHVISIADITSDNYSCDPVNITVEVVPSAVDAPTGPANQDFISGATLADIAVNGTDIQWYASATNNYNTAAFPMTASALPLTTQLVDDTTYYATQTVEGIESVARLAVTVHVALGTTDYASFALNYFPNPVKNNLTLKAGDNISSVTVMNLLGQVLKTTNYNQSEVIEDMSSYTNGTYFMKVVSANKMKVIKILKD